MRELILLYLIEYNHYNLMRTLRNQYVEEWIHSLQFYENFDTGFI